MLVGLKLPVQSMPITTNAGQWFSPGTPVSSTNKTDCRVITEILLIVALNTTNQTKPKVLNTDNIIKVTKMSVENILVSLL